ncbi:MAG: PAC2 family protein [Phycisphaerales bacterium]
MNDMPRDIHDSPSDPAGKPTDRSVRDPSRDAAASPGRLELGDGGAEPTALGRGAQTPPPMVRPWLVAAWPGMGGVASIAAGHLAQALDAKPLGMLPESEFFGVDHVEVRNGIARAGRLPRSLFFAWRDPQGRRDLVFFVGEAQPTMNGDALCRRILDVAQAHGVERVVTFAAMASALRPQDDPRVYAAVTAPAMLDEMRSHSLDLLPEGQIGGLNGALLAAAAERGMPAMCLLGEMPFFAAGAPNPKSALAAVRMFAELAGIDVDTTALAEQSETMTPQLIELHEQLRRQQAALRHAMEEASELLADEESSEAPGDAADSDDDAPPKGRSPADSKGSTAPEPPRGKQGPTGSNAPGKASPGAPSSGARSPGSPSSGASPSGKRDEPPMARRRVPALDAAGHALIESLFEAAQRDRANAPSLKRELDRFGVFGAYEDRFLDLFRKAE